MSLLVWILLAFSSGAMGGWSWDLGGAVFTSPQEGKGSILFSTPEGIPPTLWNLPGPGDSLIQYDGELGIIRFLFPYKEAFLEVPGVQSQPNAAVLWNGGLWIARDRELKVLFPPDSPGVLPPLPLPITALRTQEDQLLAQVLTGVWYIYSKGEWERTEVVPAVRGILPTVSLPPPEEDKPQSFSDHLTVMEDLMARDRWSEAKLLGLRAWNHPTLFSTESWNTLEAIHLKLNGIFLGFGKLDALWVPSGLQVSYLPDSRVPGPYVCQLRFHKKDGEEIQSLSLGDTQYITWIFPQGCSASDYLWVDVKVFRSDKPNEITILRLPSLIGLSFWLKSD